MLFAKPEKGSARVGFVAGKKVGNAVKRSRAKRRMRGLFLRMLPKLRDGDYVMVAKPPILDAPFAELVQAFEKAMRRLRLDRPGTGTDD